MLLPIRFRHALVAVLLVVAGSVVASAQDDPPGRVARLNYMSGQVSFRPASLDDWGAANVNYPLTTGDHLWTERGGRAELQLGPSVIRLASETAFSFLDLDDDVVQARVAEGSIYVRVRELGEHETYEIDTPNAAVSIVRPGIYRVDVEPDGTRTRVTVRTGLAEVNGTDGAFSVNAGDSAEISGTDEMTYDIGRASSPDAWERWCSTRDERENNSPSLRYVSDGMVGYEDLDDNGTWSYESEYGGYAWTPTVVAMDWAPYRYGHWSWVRPWGWTWIDEARWGFAPFHYGRWAYHHDHWMWMPGHYVARPVYAPAIVGFVGGLDWRFTFNLLPTPAVGWFPLGPGEIYCPAYHVSPGYVHNVNITHVNVTNINVATYDVGHGHYANRTVPGAVTAVPRDVFVASQSVQRAAVAVPRSAVERVPVVGHAIGVTPDNRSIVGRTPAVARPPAAASRRPVIARTEPPAEALHNTPVVPLTERARMRGQAVPTGEVAQPTPAQAGTWRPSTRGRDVPASRPDAAAGPATRYERGSEAAPPSARPAPPRDQAPRYEPPKYQAPPRDQAPRYEPPKYQAPPRDQAPRYEPPKYQAAPRDERPAQTAAAPRAERTTGTEDRPERGLPRATVSAPAAQAGNDAPSRAEAARSEPARERPSSSTSDRPSSPSSSPSVSRPAERGGERKPPASSNGRGGQSSEGSAKPRGRG